MNRSVQWSGRANRGLENIFITIAQDNRAAAIRVAEKLANTALRLGEFSIGRSGRVEGTYEKTVVGLPYILCYTIKSLADGKEQIIILHVIHTARHWPTGTLPH